jgi:hypothetical protein
MIFSALAERVRVVMSAGPPGSKPTTIVTGLSGNSARDIPGKRKMSRRAQQKMPNVLRPVLLDEPVMTASLLWN